MSAIQLSFSLRTSPGCKTVHLLGNWDNYRGQLPLSKDSSSSKSGAWKGTFKFSGSTLQQGQRYWYYYIIDGYHVSHDPAQPSTTEPTTKRQLNILDIPSSSSSRSSRGPALSVSTSSSSRPSTSSRHATYTSTTRAPPGSKSSSSHSSSTYRKDSHSSALAQGRSLSPSKIISPRPTKPHETRKIANARYSGREMDALSRQMAHTQVSASSFSSSGSDSEFDSDSDSSSEIDSDEYSDPPSLSSGSRSGGSSRASPSSSLASPITPRSANGSPCSCDRWSRDRSGRKVRVDCGGRSCGSSESDSDGGRAYKTKLAGRRGDDKRQGFVMRGSRR